MLTGHRVCCEPTECLDPFVQKAGIFRHEVPICAGFWPDDHPGIEPADPLYDTDGGVVLVDPATAAKEPLSQEHAHSTPEVLQG
jgi:hypothetical protein